MKTFGSIVFVLALSLASSRSLADGNKLNIVADNYPPCYSRELRDGGFISEIVVDAFKRAGYDVEIKFMPWKQAIDMANKGTDRVIIYFPGYHCHHREGFVASEPIGKGDDSRVLMVERGV